MKKFLIANRIQTPDGTILYSKNRHNFICHEDANGHTYCNDGGLDYQKTSYQPEHPSKDVSVYSTDDFEIIRNTLERHSIRGYVKLCDMSDEHVKNTIQYIIVCAEPSETTTDWIEIYQKELDYRIEHNITI